jgi:signal transduction histidine kinase
MTRTALRLVSRIIGFMALCSLFASLVIVGLAQHLLLLSGKLAREGAFALGAGIMGGGAVAILLSVLWLRRHRYLLRALAVGSRAVDTYELYELSDEPRRLITLWTFLSSGGALLSVPLRPSRIDFTTGVTLGLLGIVIVSTAALPLFMLIRSTIGRALELAPTDVMREVVEDAERFGRIEKRVSRRMIFAVATPVVFLAVGSALIVSAHLRRADERNREETARAFARAVLEPLPAPSSPRDLDRALQRATFLGFSAYLTSTTQEYELRRSKDGILIVSTPLDNGTATVSFAASRVGVLSTSTLLVALLAIAAATGLGTLLGGALGEDLRAVTREIRELGTEMVMQGGSRVTKTARFRMVSELAKAVERLAGRFRVFAKAQERSISAREAAARMRGLFFASVSHDLKSPLNAILGFTELVKKHEQVTPGQAESLGLIERRGRELLALIETILDAARVEAGQLTLVLEGVPVWALLEEAAGKARDLGGDGDVQVQLDVAPDLPRVRIDRVRLSRALATFIAQALRAAEGPSVHVSARREGSFVEVEVEVPSQRMGPQKLEALLDPHLEPGATEHRGLALGLRLGRSIVELHEGSIEIGQRGRSGAFRLRLPVDGSAPRA